MNGDARMKKMIENTHDLGLSVSYTRVMEVKQSIARAACKRYAEDGVVLPTNLRSNVEFHGTALSATNLLSWDNIGVQRDPIQIDISELATSYLPDSYVIIHPVELHGNSNVIAPKTMNSQLRPSYDLMGAAKIKDGTWMAHVSSVLEQDTIPKGEVITWSRCNSRCMSDVSVKPRAVIGVLPLFPDKDSSLSMMQHAMELTMQDTQFLNPGQTGVLGSDQPLYALAKQLQWKFPVTSGEDKLVLMMGALHIEDKAHLMIGKLLGSSGGTTVLSQAQVLTCGCAQSVLNEHHIKRTRYAHQVSLMSLHPEAHGLFQVLFNCAWTTSHWRCGINVAKQRFPSSNTGLSLWNLSSCCVALFDHSARDISLSTFKCVLSFAHGSMFWTIQMTHVGYHYMCGIWSSCQESTQMFMLSF